jgi:ferritin-like metal-binding protein YciE
MTAAVDLGPPLSADRSFGRRTALIAAAEHAGEPEIARLCRLNRGEDEDMAEWLDAQIPIVIARTLAQAPADNW